MREEKASTEECKQALWERVYPELEAFNRHGTEWRARLHVRRGKPDEQIGALAADIRADLIVVGNFGLHHPRSAAKNLPNRVLQQAVCPTLVVGMPEVLDTKQCPVCAKIREHTEGDQWFCEQHTSRNDDHATTPMTVWTGGQFRIDRAA
ncbi:MAG: universal stress protein [Myxococcota bacterium]|nr:universal stress protein [Myxococcota bacterium]